MNVKPRMHRKLRVTLLLGVLACGSVIVVFVPVVKEWRYISMLGSPDRADRIEAATSLGASRSVRAVGALCRAASEVLIITEDGQSKRLSFQRGEEYFVDAVVAIGTPAVPTLLRIINEENVQCALVAYAALELVGSEGQGSAGEQDDDMDYLELLEADEALSRETGDAASRAASRLVEILSP